MLCEITLLFRCAGEINLLSRIIIITMCIIKCARRRQTANDGSVVSHSQTNRRHALYGVSIQGRVARGGTTIVSILQRGVSEKVSYDVFGSGWKTSTI